LRSKLWDHIQVYPQNMVERILHMEHTFYICSIGSISLSGRTQDEEEEDQGTESEPREPEDEQKERKEQRKPTNRTQQGNETHRTHQEERTGEEKAGGK